MRANILDFGIAVNFFGNYQTESERLNRINENLTIGLTRLRDVLIGAGIVGAFHRFGSSILGTAKMMEANLGSLKSSLGSVEKAMANLEWARKKGAETPFGIEEVNSAVATMTSLGFNKNDEQREEVFNAVGDLAGMKGAGFADMMQRVAKAGFGNWESLGDQYGIRRQTIGEMVRNQMDATPDKFKGEEEAINKAIQLVEKGRAGTDEYRMAVVKLIGVLGRDGMLNRLETIDGALANIDDIFANFMFNMVGYSQVQGSLANAIKTTIVDNILKPLTEAHTVIIDGVEQQISTTNQLGTIGKAVGELLKSVWSGVSDSIGSIVLKFRGWIDKMYIFFQDFKNNVAPIVLFLYLIRLEVEDFLNGFMKGFKPVFGAFIWITLKALGIFAELLVKLGLGENKAEALGTALGVVVATMLGIKMIRFATAPFQPLINGAKTTIRYLKEIDWRLKFRQAKPYLLKLSMELEIIKYQLKSIKTTNPFGGSMLSSLSGMVGRMGAMATASWSFTASLLANPITWVVIAVIALVGWIVYLVMYWDEFQQKVKGVSDGVIYLISIFMPIIGIPMLLAKYWDDFSAIFDNIWRGITFKFLTWQIKLADLKEAIINKMRQAWDYVDKNVLQKLSKVWDYMDNHVFQKISKAWDFIKSKASEFMNYLFIKFPQLQIISVSLEKVWEGIGKIFKSIWGWVKDIWGWFSDSNFIGSITGAIKKWSEGFAKSSEEEYLESVRNSNNGKKIHSERVTKLVGEADKPRGVTNNSTTNNKVGQNINGMQNFGGSTINFYGVTDPMAGFKDIVKLSGR